MKPQYAEKRKSRGAGRVGNRECETVFKKKVRGHYLKPSSMTLKNSKNSKARRKRKGVLSNALKAKGPKKKKSLDLDSGESEQNKGNKMVEFADHE